MRLSLNVAALSLMCTHALIPLPYGNRARPQSTALKPIIAVKCDEKHRGDLRSDYHILSENKLDQGDVAFLIECNDMPSFDHVNGAGFEVFPIDAGPFNSLDEAVELVNKWCLDYYNCHRDADGAASCFEFGGCHKKCWWRGKGTHTIAEVRFCGHVDDYVKGSIRELLCHTQTGKSTTATNHLSAAFVMLENGSAYCSLGQLESDCCHDRTSL